MKALFVVLFTMIYSLSSVAQTMTCAGLFSEATQPLENLLYESKRLSLIETTSDKVPSKLIVEASPFSNNINEATIEIMRLLVQNSDFKLEDKNVLTKNKFTLGIPLKDGYFFEATYEAKSNIHPRFILQDKIVLVTPTGKEIKATDELLDANELKIRKSEFSLTGFSATGLEIHLRLPLVVEGELLSSLAQMASYFEYFKKSEIAHIVQNESLTKIKTLFRLRKAKDVFINVLIKQPFKSILSGVIMFAVINGQAYFPHSKVPEAIAPTSATMSQTFVRNTINNFPVPQNQIQLKAELAALNRKASALIQSKSYSGLNPYDISLDSKNIFSRQQNLFVHYRKNDASGQQQTYIVFSNDISNGAIQGLQFFSMEVNAKEFQTLINFINKHGELTDNTNLPTRLK